MELKRYWRVVRRRWWLPALLVLLTALFQLTRPTPPPMYTATMRFLVGVQPEPVPPEVYGYDRYYTWLTAEYLADDLAQVVGGSAFAARVSERLQEKGIRVPSGAIQGSTQTGKRHRILTVTVTWPNPDELPLIAQAVADTVQEDAARFFPQTFAYGAQAILVDGPHVSPVVPGLRDRLEGPARVFLALLVGLGLVFLWHYLDDRVWEGEDLAELNLPVLAEVPSPRGAQGWTWWRKKA